VGATLALRLGEASLAPTDAGRAEQRENGEREPAAVASRGGGVRPGVRAVLSSRASAVSRLDPGRRSGRERRPAELARPVGPGGGARAFARRSERCTGGGRSAHQQPPGYPPRPRRRRAPPRPSRVDRETDGGCTVGIGVAAGAREPGWPAGPGRLQPPIPAILWRTARSPAEASTIANQRHQPRAAHRPVALGRGVARW
jgi:hypothetical protein